MAFTVNDVQDFVALLRQHPEWRDRVREVVLGDDMVRIDARFERIEATLDRISVDMARFWAAIEELRATTSELRVTTADLVRKVDTLTGKVGNLEGSDYERRFHAVSRLAQYFRRPREVSIGDVDLIIEARDAGQLSQRDIEQLAALDFLVRARRGPGADAPDVYVALEVSLTVDGRDVQRVADRAAILRRAGLDAEAFAGSRVVTAEAAALADAVGVTLLVDQTSDAA